MKTQQEPPLVGYDYVARQGSLKDLKEIIWPNKLLALVG